MPLNISTARARYIRWLVAGRDLSPHTIRAYEGDLASFERHLGPRAWVNDIDGEILVSFLETQKAAGLSSASLRRRASSLRGFSAWMRSQNLLDDDPWRGTKTVASRSRNLPRVLPARELNRLIRFLQAAAGGDRRHPPGPGRVRDRPSQSTTLLGVLLMVATGMRVQETVGLRCQDIDLPGRTMRLVGKGRRERQVYLTNDWISDFAASYIEARSQLNPQHPCLLFNLRLDPLTPAAMRSRLVKAGEAADLAVRVTPHMLRHTAATQLIEAGVDIRYIQRLLGHASLSTTEIYTHVSDEALRRVVSDADVLGEVMQAR
jgi:site-specific recombinase XerD